MSLGDTRVVRKFTNFVLRAVFKRLSKNQNQSNSIPTNHNRSKQHYEPITIHSNYLQLAQTAVKITRTWCDWFGFSLVEKLARVFLADHKE